MNFEPKTRRIYCTFLNQALNRVKLCNASIMYGANCDQQLGIYSGMGTGVAVATTSLVLLDGNEYCFSITASNGNKTVIVEGVLNVVMFGN